LTNDTLPGPISFEFKSYRTESHTGRNILIERENIVNWRCAYLQQIGKFRETGKPILCLDETWVDASLAFRKCWQNKEFVGITTNVNTPNRLIVVHLGGSGGFVEGCE
jgi:hypothetical protein